MGLHVSSSTSTAHLQWNPLPRDQVHGIILGYRVLYYDYYGYEHRKTITTNNTQVVLKHLLPGMKYYAQVRGFTSKGQGPLISTRFITSKSLNIKSRSFLPLTIRMKLRDETLAHDC